MTKAERELLLAIGEGVAWTLYDMRVKKIPQEITKAMERVLRESKIDYPIRDEIEESIMKTPSKIRSAPAIQIGAGPIPPP